MQKTARLTVTYAISLGIPYRSCLFATEGSSSCTGAQDRFPCNLQNECRYTHKTTTRTATKENFSVMLPSKNGLARNILILQVFFLQDLGLNLASLALKMKLFLQDMNNLARILQEKFTR